jgi:hypothetical protein
MLKDGDFPENTLFCGDAGFVGYPLWSRIIARGSHFLVRVGANVSLLYKSANVRLSGNRVFCWPQDAQSKNLPPLELRLIKVQVGKTKMWMLTSVLDSTRLPKSLIARFYQLRWGIEISQSHSGSSDGLSQGFLGGYCAGGGVVETRPLVLWPAASSVHRRRDMRKLSRSPVPPRRLRRGPVRRQNLLGV